MTIQEIRTVEEKIIRKLLEDCISQGLEVDLWDGESYPVRKSVDVDDIVSKMFTVDDESLLLWKNGKRFGSIWLVHGNGRDVIADCSSSMDFIVEPVIRWVETWV